MEKNIVILDHDGHIDDLICFILLYNYLRYNLQVVGVTSGDCYVEHAVKSCLNIANYLDMSNVEIAFSNNGCVNDFPDLWRKESELVPNLPLFMNNKHKSSYQNNKCRDSLVAYKDCIENANRKVTIIATGPLTNIAHLLNKHKNLIANIKEIFIMGGSFDVPGNVNLPNFNKSAEWNIFANPQAFKDVLKTGIPIKLIPLDITNSFPMDKSFFDKLQQNKNVKAVELSLALWSLVNNIEYYYWDTVTAMALMKPEMFEYTAMKIDVITSGKDSGKTIKSFFGGIKVMVATKVQTELFEQNLIDILLL